MKLDPMLYGTIIPTIILVYNKEKDFKSAEEIGSLIATVTHVPLLAVLLWMQYLYGNVEGIEEAIERIIKFYGYTDVMTIDKRPLVVDNNTQGEFHDKEEKENC